jgi:endonuclease III
MSDLSARILGVRRNRRSPWPARWAEIADRLVAEYGVPSLGNFRNPVKEIFYILLSAKTADAQYRRTNRALHLAYPTLESLASAKPKGVRVCIESGGLAATRAVQIIALAKALLKAGAPKPARYLRSLDAEKAFAFLTGLPGVGPKSAFCVMMYSLDRDVFPVDVNVIRIAERLGALRRGFDHTKAQKALAKIAPTGRSKDLHIGLVVHGREVCTPRNPKCGECCLVELCPTGRKVTRSTSPAIPSIGGRVPRPSFP